MKRLYSVAVVALLAGCSLPARMTADGQQHPVRIGVLTASTKSRCRTAVIAGEPQRICIRGRTPSEPVREDTTSAEEGVGETAGQEQG